MIPTTNPTNLSEGARNLYAEAVRNERQVKIDNTNTEAMSHATEIAEARLGRLNITQAYGSTLSVTPLAKGFSVARRDDARDYQGYTYIEVEVLREPNAREGALVAALFGAKFTHRSGQGSPWPRWTAEVRHATAVDSDHSGCILATLDIDNPVLDYIDGTATTFKGILTGIKMWPTGTDITLRDSRNGSPIEEPEMCDCGRGGDDTPHPYGPYLPPARDDLNAYLGRSVLVTVTPVANVTDDGLHTSRSTITRADY